MLRLVLLIASSVLAAAKAGARSSVLDHLVPWVYGFDRDLRPLLEKKLLITLANCGRTIRMHQMTIHTLVQRILAQVSRSLILRLVGLLPASPLA